MAKKYRTIVIDPPWPGPGAVASFERRRPNVIIPYVTMTGIQVASLRVRELATDDAIIWIWCTSRAVADGYLLAQGWGFTYRALFVWQKPLGMGRHCRHDSEFLLQAALPGAPLVDPKRCPPQTHRWPRPKRHSEKPAEAYEFIKSLSPGPRIDIFARQSRPGFAAWGNEATAA